MLDDPSIELIAVESNVRGNMNFGYAQKAIAAGKHVHLDKPPGDSLPALKELLESAAKQGQIVQLGYQWRYHPAMQKAIEAARKGWSARRSTSRLTRQAATTMPSTRVA